MIHLAALICGFALDALFGDPYSMPHIIRLIGRLIAWAERMLRAVFPATPRGERTAGVVLVALVVGLSCGTSALVLWLAGLVSPWLAFMVESFVCYQMIAAMQLRIEARRVYDALQNDGLAAARTAVSMIVGRDTAALDEAGVTRAAVETVAENTSDGVVAPLLFMALGGAPAGVLYKAVNTMDSMVGYVNDRYRFFGTAAARLDDVLNWMPARLTGALMCLVAPLVGLDGRGAWRVFLRDRLRHASPNSAHPEAACAGALGVQLAGPASYFGVLHDKPTIGDAARPIEPEDIVRANRLLTATSIATLLLCIALGVLVRKALGRW
jgi:adenosylcobinamide-phosphate synthase